MQVRRWLVEMGANREVAMPTKTPRVDRVLASAASRATELGHEYLGTEHVLLGLLDNPDGVASRVIEEFVSLDQLRDRLLLVLASEGYNTKAEGP